MIKLHNWLKKTILQVVDYFYPPFKKVMPLQTFRYAACGGGTTLLGIFLYFIAFHFIYTQPVIDLKFVKV